MPGPLASFLVGGVFGKFLAVVLGAVIGRIILAFGISLVTYTGITVAFVSLKSEFDALLATAPGALLTLLDMGGFLNATNMIFAAFVAVASVKAFTGTLKAVRLI